MRRSFSFDPTKDEANRVKHGLSLVEAETFDFETAFKVADTRRDYGEVRVQVYGMLHDRLHVLVINPRPGGDRVISLRRANKREVRRYGGQVGSRS